VITKAEEAYLGKPQVDELKNMGLEELMYKLH